MALQFVLGNSGAGKSYYLYQNVLEQAREYPERTYLVIVPEQIGMQTQKELVSMSPRGGIMNIDVISFQRLAFRVFSETGNVLHPVLDDTGKTLVLQKIIQKERKNLKTLGESLKKTGTVSEMKSLISELMQYDIRPSEMERLQEQAASHPLLCHKLKDVEVIYRSFQEYLKERYITKEEILDVLCDRAEDSQILKNSQVMLDGFTGFTPVQLKVLRKLLRICRHVTVAVTVDPRADLLRMRSPQHLFRMSGQMMERLIKIAGEERVEVKDPVRVEPGRHSRFSQAPALDFLEKRLFRYGKHEYTKEQQEIRIAAAASPRQEMEYAALQILRMVREKGYRYRDFAVITGDLAGYAPCARQAMETCEIPYFLDEKHSLLLNPFVEYLRAALTVITENFSYESVFRYLRSGFSGISAEETDRLENYCIALGIRGWKQWQEHWVRRYKGLEEGEAEEINQIRIRFVNEMEELTRGMREGDRTVLERTRMLYEFILRGRMQERLAEQERELEAAGEKELAGEYGQIYRIVMELLDKVTGILGDEKISLRDYLQMLEAGFQEAQVGILPPSLDQVVIGDLERTRLKDIRVLFLVGANDSVIPKRSGRGGLLSEADREFLEGANVELAPTARETMYIQKFYLYLAMTRPSHRLMVSYAKTGGQGETLGPAYLIPMLCRMYPELRIYDAEEEPSLLSLAERPRQSRGLLIRGLENAAQGEETEEWRVLFDWFLQHPAWREDCEKWVDAAFCRSPDDRISKSAARALYGNVLENSATRLERYAACAYAHFLQYGLEISPREVYELRSADMGNVIHQVLERFSRNLKKQKLSWRNLTDSQRETLIQESVEEVVEDYGNTIFHSSARNEYRILRIRRILQRTVWALQKQLQAGDYEPSRFEIVFSMENDLQAVNFNLSEKEKLRLKGRIDRMDRCEKEDQILVKVIDYKSGNTSMDLIALYYGLQLQLVVYMNAAVEIEQREYPDRTVEPAGIFYYQVKDPLAEGGTHQTDEEIEEKILSLLRPQGLIREDPEVLATLDHDLAEGRVKKSRVIPAACNKDGSLSKNSSAATKEQFAILSAYVNRKIRSLGKEILEGNVQVNPYQRKQETACGFCPYRGVCGFDERIPGYHFRNLPAFGKTDIWKHMEEQLDAAQEEERG